MGAQQHARRAVTGGSPGRSSSASPRASRSPPSSATCSTSGCPEPAGNARPAALLRGGLVALHFADAVQHDMGGAARHRRRRAARPHRHDGRRAAHHAHLQDGARPGDPDADLHVCRRHLWRQPQRHPAQHPRHAGERGDDARRLSARQGRPRRRGHGHRHHLVRHRHGHRHAVPRRNRAGARQRGARLPFLRVFSGSLCSA